MVATTSGDQLTTYYEQVKNAGKLRTVAHAQRWSQGILQILGFHLDGGTKKALAKALPAELGNAVTRIFWLLHFKESNLSALKFQKQVANRCGATDAQYARLPILAVFHQVKGLINHDLATQVAKSLSPEVRQLWESA